MLYTVTSDEAELDNALVRLWGPILPSGSDPNRRFRWYYQANPKGAGKVLLLACDQGPGQKSFVGCAGIGARMMHVNGLPMRAAQLADLGVEREHRTVMPALTLTRAVQSRCRGEYAFSYGFPNQQSIGVYARIGYHEVGKLTRYALVLRHARYVKEKVPVAALAHAVGVALDTPSRLGRLGASLRRGRALALDWASRADARFDALWERSKARFPILQYRGSDYLRWRFFEHPSRAFDVAVLTDGAGIRAYAVVERVDGVASVWDLLGQSDGDVRALLDLLAGDMRRRGAFALSIHCVGPLLGDLLVSCGFRKRESAKSLVIDMSKELTSAERSLLRDPASWYMPDGGEDS